MKDKVEIRRLSHDEDEFDYQAFVNNVQAGRIQSIVTGHSVYVTDIEVEKRFLHPWPVLTSVLNSLLWVRVRDMRSKGIGRLLFGRLLADVRAAGMKEVWGCIVEKDLTESPFLIGWYKRKGFDILEPDDHCVAGALHKIFMRL